MFGLREVATQREKRGAWRWIEGFMSRSYSLHEIPLYGWSIYLFSDRKKWARVAAKHIDVDSEQFTKDADSAGGISVCHDQHAYVGVFDGQPGTIAHEATHVAMEILSHASVRYGQNQQEPLAYLIGHITDLLFTSIFRSKRKC
jgi:hypothetical protein